MGFAGAAQATQGDAPPPVEPAAGLGRFAPPRDPAQAKTEHRRADAVWAGVVLALATAIVLSIWLAAGR